MITTSTFATIDPTTGKEIERFAYTSKSDVDAKLAIAQAGAKNWAATPFEQRAQLLRAVARTLRNDSDRLARTATQEMGKPIVQARAEVEKCAWGCEYFADNGPAMLAPQQATSNASRSYVAFRPLGIVLAIMPWNFPYWQLFRAAAPAMIAGNVVAMKHADNTTRCALEIERVFRDAGAPDGLMTTLLMNHEDVDNLIADRRIAGVTLTGSERAGVAVASAAGASLKKCVLELGGSDAFVVLADADLEDAARTGVRARFQNNGQSCIAAKRFIVEDSVHDAFLERFVALTKAQLVGNPMDEATDVGPMARADLRKGLHDQVRATLDAGAVLMCGGRPIDGPGAFFEPTVVDGVEPGMAMFDEETFGPAAAIARAGNPRHAIALANASSYGLGFNIWTKDIALAETLAQQVEAGNVFINGMVASDPRLPFGGVKKSGYGRELAAFGAHEFVNIQTVWIGPAQGNQSAVAAE